MKKLIGILLLLIVSVVGFAQSSLPDIAATFDLSIYFASLTAVVGLVVLLTEWVQRYVPNMHANWTRVVSWLISIAVCFFGWLTQLGIFVGIEWWWCLVYGVGAGFAANGAFTIPVIQALIKAIFGTKKKIM